MENQIDNSALAKELNDAVQKLEKERLRLKSERVSLGLAIDPKDPYGTRWCYPPTPSREEAYLKARDKVGGEWFVVTRREFYRLEQAERQTATELIALEERTSRYFSLGKIVPNNAQRIRKLTQTHENVSRQFIESAHRLENHLSRLRTPESREAIRKEAEALILKYRNTQAERNKADKKFISVVSDLKELVGLRKSLEKLDPNALHTVERVQSISGVIIPRITRTIHDGSRHEIVSVRRLKQSY